MRDATGNSSNTSITTGAGFPTEICEGRTISPEANTSCETEDPNEQSEDHYWGHSGKAPCRPKWFVAVESKGKEHADADSEVDLEPCRETRCRRERDDLEREDAPQDRKHDPVQDGTRWRMQGSDAGDHQPEDHRNPNSQQDREKNDVDRRCCTREEELRVSPKEIEERLGHREYEENDTRKDHIERRGPLRPRSGGGGGHGQVIGRSANKRRVPPGSSSSLSMTKRSFRYD